jgi:hypothetical protein
MEKGQYTAAKEEEKTESLFEEQHRSVLVSGRRSDAWRRDC